ncbi:cyclase family protein [Saprospiraceae bacterium]|nr:cyclase family protein [Saprospiraceae bacterium]
MKNIDQLNINNYIDISVTSGEFTPRWPGSKGLEIQRISLKENGAFATNSVLKMDVHFGTHIDSPLHHIPGGKTTNEIPLSKTIGKCYVLDFRNYSEINQSDLDNKLTTLNISSPKKLLLKTDNSNNWRDKNSNFEKKYIAITKQASDYLANIGIELIGIDYHSIQKFNDNAYVHETLLRNEIVILETINLDNVEEGEYSLICAPLKINNLEGAPCRAILFKN